MLWFAPPAFGDAGLTRTKPATPVATPQIPVEKAISGALATSVAKASSVDRQPVAAQPTPQQRRPRGQFLGRHRCLVVTAEFEGR
jgi:hypothetical protein